MRTTNALLILAFLAFTALTGCTTGPDGKQRIDAKKVEPWARLAAYGGTRAMLVAKPETRPAFDVGAAALRALVGEDWQAQQAALKAILAQFPVDQINDADIGIAVETFRDLFEQLIDGLGGVSDELKTKELSTIALALADGVERALTN